MRGSQVYSATYSTMEARKTENMAGPAELTRKEGREITTVKYVGRTPASPLHDLHPFPGHTQKGISHTLLRSMLITGDESEAQPCAAISHAPEHGQGQGTFGKPRRTPKHVCVHAQQSTK